MYKIGDKLICIKERGNMNLLGNTYTIVKINHKNDVASVNVENPDGRLFDYCDYKIYLVSKHDHVNSYLLEDHFISLKETRKQKLKKIYER